MASTPWTLRVPETANAGIPGEFPNPVGGKLFSVRADRRPPPGCANFGGRPA